MIDRLVAGCVGVAAMGAAQGAMEPIDWPESPLVESWLQREAAVARQRLLSTAPGGARDPVQPAVPRPPAVELIAVYGVGHRLAFDLRIGRRRHVLRPETATSGGVASYGQGGDRIVGDSFDGRCLRLTYRRVVRKLCLPASEPLAGAKHGD